MLQALLSRHAVRLATDEAAADPGSARARRGGSRAGLRRPARGRSRFVAGSTATRRFGQAGDRPAPRGGARTEQARKLPASATLRNATLGDGAQERGRRTSGPAVALVAARWAKRPDQIGLPAR